VEVATQKNVHTHKKMLDKFTSHVPHSARSYVDKLAHTQKKIVAN